MSDMLIVNDPFTPDLRMHPSDWDRGSDGREKFRERREEVIRAFDSAMASFGRDREFVADRLAYVAAAVLSAGVGLGLDLDATMRLKIVIAADDADAPDAPTLRDEVAAVLAIMDAMPDSWTCCEMIRLRCRTRLRAALERSDV